MKLAFCLLNYFPFGGLQRDFLQIVKKCQADGHEIHIFTMKWEGPRPENMTIEMIKPKGFSNHQRAINFSRIVNQRLKELHFDCVVGFNKMAGLDIYYAADGCFVMQPKYRFNPFLQLFNRYQTYKALEESVFGEESKTEILCISPAQTLQYQKYYHTPSERLHALPPGIRRDCIPPENVLTIRKETRKKLGVSDDELMLITIASHFQTKGVDRAIQALKALPQEKRGLTKLFVVGPDKPEQYRKLITDEIKEKVIFLGAREDIPTLLFAADLMVHFARVDNTGTVILEAIVAGVPVLCSAQCGYSLYVKLAHAGQVLPEKFTQTTANKLLASALDKAVIAQWHQRALAFVTNHDLFSMVDKAAGFIESFKRL